MSSVRMPMVSLHCYFFKVFCGYAQLISHSLVSTISLIIDLRLPMSGANAGV